MKILVVDDIFARRKWLKQKLESQGHKVIIATDGMAALVKVMTKGIKFQLVLTDTKMPNLTGPELMEEMNLRQIKTPIIGMSNREESRTLYQYFWNKNEPVETLYQLINTVTSTSKPL